MNSKVTRTIVNIVLVLLIICFLWPFETPRQGILIKSIGAPISFKNEKRHREEQIVQRLKDIRDAEIQYKQANNKYTSNFDTLIDFCKTYEIPTIKMVTDTADTVYFNEHSDYRTYSDTIGYRLVADSLFGKRVNFNLNDLSIVPFSDPVATFEIHDSIIKRGGISVPVFEVKTPFEVYLAKPGKKFTEKEWNTRVRNEKAELEQLDKYAGLKVGSLEENTTDGNWEKL